MIDRPFSADRPLPEGVRDFLFADALARREMEGLLRELWTGWGYRELILPTFEYASTLSTDVGSNVDAEMYRFFDREGRTLALRPDMTIPTARVVATRLVDQPLPHRLAYVGSVFRHEAARAGRQHEFSQAGIELVGAQGAWADAESIVMAVEALRTVGPLAFGLTVGHVGFFSGMLSALGLSSRAEAQVRSALDRRAEGELERLASELPGMTGVLREALLTLPRLIGGREVLEQAERFCLNARMGQAIAQLRAILALLDGYGVLGELNVDLAEARELDYYTGLTFEAFAPGLGFNLLSGGRYDDLVGHFGPSLPAVGWAFNLDRALAVRERQGVAAATSPAEALLSPGVEQRYLAWAAGLRRMGLRIEIDLTGRAQDALWEVAQQRGIPRIAWPSAGVDGGDEPRLNVRDDDGQREVGWDDRQEVERWRSR